MPEILTGVYYWIEDVNKINLRLNTVVDFQIDFE